MKEHEMRKRVKSELFSYLKNYSKDEMDYILDTIIADMSMEYPDLNIPDEDFEEMMDTVIQDLWED